MFECMYIIMSFCTDVSCDLDIIRSKPFKVTRTYRVDSRSLRTCRTTADGLKRRCVFIYMCRSRAVLTACGATGLRILILIVIQVELLAELVGKRCCAFLVAHRAKEIEFPLDTSTSGGTKAIAVAVISQTSINVGDSEVMVRNRDKTSRKDEDDAFAKILAGKRPPENHLCLFGPHR